MSSKVHVFWDNSNIFIPAKYVTSRREGTQLEPLVRIQFEALFNLAKAGRQIGSAICVGSVPPELRSVWDRLRAAGVTVELYERGAVSGTEQGVDQCLQVHMLRTLVDSPQPAVAVLLTGDGAGYDTGIGYHADLERMHRSGWGIEVLAWDAACRRALKDWAQQVGHYIPLDDYYESVTFIEGGRRNRPLSLTRRPRANPRI